MNKKVFVCDTCNHIFYRQFHLNNHKNKNACKIKNHKCKYCNKGFTSTTSLSRHIKSFCKVKKEDDSKKDMILERLIKLEEDNIKIKKDNCKIKKENNKLKLELKKLKQSHNINNNINNGTINNIVLIGHGKEDLSKIDNNDILKSLKKGFYSTIYLTETVHFNPKYPEYHNVYISNIKDKYAMMYDGNKWTLTRKAELIERLYEDKRNYIEDNMEYFLETLSKSQIRALERWLNTDDEHDKIKEVKDKIKLLLYNKRDVIIDSKNEL